MEKRLSGIFEISLDDVIYNIGLMDEKEIKAVIETLEENVGDWRFTQELAEHFVKEVGKLFADDAYSIENTPHKKAWESFLRGQLLVLAACK